MPIELHQLLVAEQATAEARSTCQVKGAFAVDPVQIATLNADIDASYHALEARFGSPSRRWVRSAELVIHSLRIMCEGIVNAVGIPIFALALLTGIVMLGLMLALGALLQLSIPLTIMLGVIFGIAGGFASAAFIVTIPLEDAKAGRATILQWWSELTIEKSRHRALLNRLSTLNELSALRQSFDAQASATAELRRQYESVKNQLSMTNWRSLRGVEFEQFLMKVLQYHGFAVSTTKKSGDQGVDLIASCSLRKLAIQVKGYESSVGNSAVQEAHAGKDHYRCSQSVVITNSVFTKSARELAKSVNCVLIDETQMPDLIAGRILNATRLTNSGSSAV